MSRARHSYEYKSLLLFLAFGPPSLLSRPCSYSFSPFAVSVCLSVSFSLLGEEGW